MRLGPSRAPRCFAGAGFIAPGRRTLKGPVIESVRIARVHDVQTAGECPALLSQMGRSIKRPLVLFLERWRFFASKRSGNNRFYCRRPYFMTEKNGDFHAIQIVRPWAPGQNIAKYANWSVARMTYLPPKKARLGALSPLRDCRAGAVRAIWVFGLCLSLAACGSLGGMLGVAGLSRRLRRAPPPYQGEQIGSGPARVALILPMT